MDHGGGVVAVRADNPGPLTLTGTKTYVIGVEAVVVLDPGPLEEAHLARVDAAVAGRDVVAVCLTHSHRDHSAAAGAAAERWGTLRASEETLDRIELDGAPLADEEALPLGSDFALRALATPGHSGDHLCYLLEPERALFTGDLVLGESSSIIVHPDGSVRDYLESLDRLLALEPTRLLPGHGSEITAAVERLHASRVHRVERTKQVLGAVEGGASSLAAIREAVYRGLPQSHHAAAELSIQAYLAFLRAEGHEVPPDPD